MPFEQPPMDTSEAQNKMVQDDKERPAISYEQKAGTSSKDNFVDLMKKHGMKIRTANLENPNEPVLKKEEKKGAAGTSKKTQEDFERTIASGY
jgi:hypothetical protein